MDGGGGCGSGGGGGRVRPLRCSLQVISAHRGAWRWKYRRDPAEGFSRVLYGAVRRHPHPSAALWRPRGRSQEWAPRRLFHRRGPENEPAPCQLDKENKMENTEV